ncbi:biopolymer transporter ExbD [Pannonibacter indicus]|uniref:Biopolymer transport protein ExbD n=1 Tax=Pannonibacter indicus TaxID=466044 RepID=A0A0K6HYE1_9HYPH|nr:biopolymer transporter ExbD [Pannonibacter indicus]CUA95828.1 Biopolymer transport protein ExbD [Pannonibacter indicus]
MRINMPQRRRRPLSMTSLIDVIFLLLLFFMLSTTFTRFAGVDLGKPGQAGGGASGTPGILVFVEADGLRINGVTVMPEEMADRLADLQDKGATSALVVAREGANAQGLIDAVQTVRRLAPALTLHVAR